MSRDNLLLPILQVAISLDHVKYMADFMQHSGVTFLGFIEVEEKGNSYTSLFAHMIAALRIPIKKYHASFIIVKVLLVLVLM